MIVTVKKYLFYGMKNQMSLFFEEAQKRGFIEFIPKVSSQSKEMPENVKHILQAIKILQKWPLRKEAGESSEPPLDVEIIAEKILHANHQIGTLYEEERILKSEIARVAPFGDFSMSDIAYVEKYGNRFIQFFSVKTEKALEMKLPEELIYVGTDYELDYFIAIQKTKKSYPQLFEMHIDKPLGVLKAQLKQVQEQRHRLEEELKELTSYISLLRKKFLQVLDEHHLQEAEASATSLFSESLFVVTSWVPKNKMKELEIFVRDFSINYEEIREEKSDRRPTYMENQKWNRVGEDLVHIYDTPSTADKDPSKWVLIFFSIFFAVIVSDAGYGLVFLALALFLKFKFKNPKKMLKRFTKLVFLLATTCIVWGVITASFFGMEIPIESPLNKVSVLHFMTNKKAEYHIKKQDDVYYYWLGKYPDLKKESSEGFLQTTSRTREDKVEYEALTKFYDNILMEFSILMGIFHIIFGFLRYLKRNWSGFGWILFMVGGYLYFPSILNATTYFHFLNILDKPTSYQIGEVFIYSGIASAVGLAILQRGIRAGISEVMNVVQVFGDVLSYLRLYALSLAGMIMASTFNDMGLKMGLIIGSIVIFAGHAMNIVLTTMGGVIHGLRLNFLEWYHYSFEGGGRKFNPLKKQVKE